MVHGHRHFHFFFLSFFPPFGTANQQQQLLLCNIILYRVGNCTIARPHLLPFSINLLISFDCAKFFYVFSSFMFFVCFKTRRKCYVNAAPLCHHQFRFSFSSACCRCFYGSEMFFVVRKEDDANRLLRADKKNI